jgi:hypothetical protein
MMLLEQFHMNVSNMATLLVYKMKVRKALCKAQFWRMLSSNVNFNYRSCITCDYGSQVLSTPPKWSLSINLLSNVKDYSQCNEHVCDTSLWIHWNGNTLLHFSHPDDSQSQFVKTAYSGWEGTPKEVN